jgi:hypothetical protein
MRIDEKIITRLDELLQMGERVLASRRDPGRGSVADARVDAPLAHQWATSVQNLLSRVFGQHSEHYKNFAAKVVDKQITYSPAARAYGVLRAAKDDYINDQLFDLRTLVEAEVFDDLLEQASHLLEAGYSGAAAVVAGCVLEDGLRKLCDRASIELPAKPKLDWMNSELAKANIYNKLVQKRITMLADVRNKAAHGEWAEFSRLDVEEMVDGVRRLMGDHFG